MQLPRLYAKEGQLEQKRNPLHPDEEHYVCPRCGYRGTRREFHTLGITPEFFEYCIPIRVCPRDGCYHKFAPKPTKPERSDA